MRHVSITNHWTCALIAAALCAGCRDGAEPQLGKPDFSRRSHVVRIATFNVSLNRDAAGELRDELSRSNSQSARRITEIIQRVRPDILLLNELDGNDDGQAARLLLKNYLQISQNGLPGLEYPFVYVAAVNTGVPSGQDRIEERQNWIQPILPITVLEICASTTYCRARNYLSWTQECIGQPLARRATIWSTCPTTDWFGLTCDCDRPCSLLAHFRACIK